MAIYRKVVLSQCFCRC